MASRLGRKIGSLSMTRNIYLQSSWIPRGEQRVRLFSRNRDWRCLPCGALLLPSPRYRSNLASSMHRVCHAKCVLCRFPSLRYLCVRGAWHLVCHRLSHVLSLFILHCKTSLKLRYGRTAMRVHTHTRIDKNNYMSYQTCWEVGDTWF